MEPEDRYWIVRFPSDSDAVQLVSVDLGHDGVIRVRDRVVADGVLTISDYAVGINERGSDLRSSTVHVGPAEAEDLSALVDVLASLDRMSYAKRAPGTSARSHVLAGSGGVIHGEGWLYPFGIGDRLAEGGETSGELPRSVFVEMMVRLFDSQVTEQVAEYAE